MRAAFLNMAITSILITLFTLVEYSWTVDVLKIGVILPLNGSYPFVIHKTLPAIQLAVDHVDRLGMLPGHRMELVVRDSHCSESEAPLAAMELYTQKNAHVFLGPACDYAVAPVARFSYRWDIPLLTSGALVSAFHNKLEYKLLTRVLGSYSKLGEFFIQVMENYNWTHLGLIYSDSKGSPSTGRSNCFFAMEAIYLEIKKKHSYSPWHLSFDIDKPDVEVKDIVDKARENARILVMCASPDHIRRVLLAAQDSYTDVEEFVFFNIDLFGSYGSTEKPWYRKEDSPEINEKARKAYESLMAVTVKTPTNSKRYKSFSDSVKKKAKEMYPDALYDEEVNHHAWAFYDAVILYTLAVKDTLMAGGNISDGAAITKTMWNSTFNGITGTVSIDENGDRNMDYSLLDMNPETGIFEVVANGFSNKQQYEPVPGKNIHWAGGRTSPPPDTVPCGFDGAICAPDKKSPFPAYGIVLIVLGLLVLIAFVAIFVIYRWKFSNYNTMSAR